MFTKKKIILLTVLFVFIADTLLSGTIFGWQKTRASGNTTNIISVFVDKNIVGGIGSQLDRFTKQYIGRNDNNAKVMVFQIDPAGISPADMVKINQNLYLEGEKNNPSRLVGTILIGDLKLPVVNKDGYIFPTVYPLVDFDQIKYYYDANSDYFLYQGEGNSQPEIWHSLINFGSDTQKYNSYFDKLRQYAQDPQKRVAKGIRYDDIIQQKQTLNADNINKYVNNYVFSEDVMYNRYTNLMVDIYQALHNSGVVETVGDYDTQVINNLEDAYYNDQEFQDIKSKYKEQIEKFWKLIKTLKDLVGSNNSSSASDPDPSNSALGTLPNSKFINTLFIQKVVDGFMKEYLELYGTSYFDTKEKRLQLGSRYTNQNKLKEDQETEYAGSKAGQKTQNGFAHDHISIATKRDEVSKQLLTDANTKLEKALDDRIEQEGYSMNVVVPTKIEVPKNGGSLGGLAGGLFKAVKTYEVYYFGKPAEYLKNSEEFGIYRGTFNNIRSLGRLNNFDYTSWMDYNKNQSIGATRGENAREVESHRGYNFSLIDYDQKQFEGYADSYGKTVVGIKDKMPYSKIKKKRGGKDISKYVSWYRAGYTPLNIDPSSEDVRLNISKMDYTQLWNPYLDRSIGGWVYDIAGSRITTDERKIGFTLGTQDEDNDDDSDSDSVASNTKSYSGYSDSYLGMNFFGSAIQVSRDDGKRLKFKTRNGKYKYRNTGKPRIKDRNDINLFSLGLGAGNDGLFLMPQNANTYFTVASESDKNWNRYFKSVDSRFFHKSPTLEEMYGNYTQLENFHTGAYGCDLTPPQLEDEEGQCTGVVIGFTDLFLGNVGTKLYATHGDDYFITGGKIYFNQGATWYERGQHIDLSSIIGTVNGSSITFNFGNKHITTSETKFDCDLRNVDDVQVNACQGAIFTINNNEYIVDEKYLDFENNTVSFYPGAKISVMGKDYSLEGLKAVIQGDKKAIFTGKQLQIGGMNEFTLERPVDSPRYLNFQGIGGDKLTWSYPNMRKVPVFKEEDGKRVLKSVGEIEIALKQYLVDKAKDYNGDLIAEKNKRKSYYEGNEGGTPRRFWLDKLQVYDPLVSPLLHEDDPNKGFRLYNLIPDAYFIDQLATTWGGELISSNDMVKILAEQLYYQNLMWLQLPIDTSKKVLNEVSLIQSFADVNHKSHDIYNEYLTQQPDKVFAASASHELNLPYYNPSGYEVAYINSDGADYIQSQSLPPLIKLIQKQKAQEETKKPRGDLGEVDRCSKLIPPSYAVPLAKRPQAFKCRLNDTLSSKVFDIKFSFNGSANGVFGLAETDGSGWLENTWEEGTSQHNQKRKRYSDQRRSTLKKEDSSINDTVKRDLYQKLDNLIIKPTTYTPALSGGLTLRVDAKKNIGNYSIKVSSTGANCLKAGSRNLCASEQVINIQGLTSKQYQYTFVKFAGGVGDMNIQVAVCSNQCIYKNMIVTVQPDDIAVIDFIHPMGQDLHPVARGVQLPIVLQGFDVYGNAVGTTPYDFLTKTSHQGGLIYNNELNESFQINSFVNAGFLLDTYSVQGNKETVQIGPNPVFAALRPNLPKQELNLTIIDPKVTLSSSLSQFKLPESNTGIETVKEEISYVDIAKLPKVKVNINNGQDIYAVSSIKSLGGKFIPGIKGKKKLIKPDKTYLEVDTFIPANQKLSTGGIVEFYLYPTMKAGDDVIQVQVGNTIETITVTVKPANAKKTSIKLETQTTDLQGAINGTLFVTDIWGNSILDPVNVLLGVYGNAKIDGIGSGGSVISIAGEKSFLIRPVYPGGQVYVFATLDGISFDQQYPDYKSILIQNRSWPIENVNAAYVNLYGTNRANQTDKSTNKLISQTMLSNSKKVLAITTSYVDPGQIMKTEFLLNHKGQITVGATNDIELSIANGLLGLKTAAYGFLPLNNSNEFSMKVVSDLKSIIPGNTWYLSPKDDTSLITVMGKQLLVDGKPIIDLQNGIVDDKVNVTYASTINGYTQRSITYNNLFVAHLIQTVRLQNTTVGDRKTIIDPTKYTVNNVLSSQQHDIGVAVYLVGNSLAEDDHGVPSIQHSKDSAYNIGFGDTFKPITNFTAGEAVGEASVQFASEFVVNLGDPTYRINETNQLVDHTKFEGSLGTNVFTDPEKTIQQVIDIDRDKQGDRDLLIAYTDGKVRLLLAQGNKTYKKLGDLMYIEDGIQKLYVGDGDGDGYQDIFVHTLSNQLRFYKNNDGDTVDVDGYPVCLDVPGGDKSLDGVWQRFLTDPNNDKVTDIVVNDKNNQIKLFLGGGGSTLFSLGFGGGNYISKDKFSCDPDWKKRQEGKFSIIKSFAPQVNNVQIRDESLVHRKGLGVNVTTSSPLDTATNITSADQLDNPDKIQFEPNLPNMDPKHIDAKALVEDVKGQLMDTFNPKVRAQTYIDSLDNTITLDGSFKPSYENNEGDQVYKQCKSLIATDKADSYKTFTDLNGGNLEDGDVVKVDISIVSKGGNPVTYIEKLSGPWEVPANNGKQVGFFAGNLNSDYQFILQPGTNYVFMIDNIKVAGTVNFGYHVVYRSNQLVTIKHNDDFIKSNGLGGSIGGLFSTNAFAQSNAPSWLEIVPIDGCAKFKRKIQLKDTGPILGNWFFEQKEDLQKQIQDAQDKNQADYTSGMSETFNNLVDDKTNQISAELKDAYLKETWKQKGVLKDDPALQAIEQAAYTYEAIGNLSVKQNVSFGGFGNDIDAILNDKVTNLTRGLCDGYKIGEKSCSGVPVLSNLPWNMAFLAPGDMQVMGCKVWKDKGVPLLRFPATLQTPVGPIPFLGPIGQKGPGDGFYRIGGGTYTSLIRMYAAPTLTAKLGIGICFGPYQLGIKLPKPFRDIMGNCIVFSVDPGLGKCEQVNEGSLTGLSSYVIDEQTKSLDDTNICNDDISIKNSSLKLVETAVNSADNWLESTQGEYGIVIKMGGFASLTNYNSLSIGDFASKVKLEGGNALDLKIKSANDKGLVSCLLNQFADNQIRYIVNNLTSMDINIVLPDFRGFSAQIGGIASVFNKNARNERQSNDGFADYNTFTADALEENKANIKQLVVGKQSKQQVTKRLDTVLSNPFEKLALFFDESELINISSRDVVVEIPRVYKEDIATLKGILLAWSGRNMPVIQQRKDFYLDLTKQCERITDQFEKQACKEKANQVLQINNQLGQFEKSIRRNIQVLDEYGEFPSKVYNLLHGYDSYIYDLFNFAYGTIDAVTSRLSKLARGFDAWVDFVVSLIGIIKSWQILIDFSVNRKEKCSKCTVDNYSAYSCSFSKFCPKLPVFNIPPFKIPDITIDLSDIDLRTDIILPKFRFQPKRVSLFDNLKQFGIPDLPYPRQIGLFDNQLNLKLPSIPVFPSPPDLDSISLPSFIPQIKFSGPMLPPAPKIPKIAPELGLAIDIADFIGRIFCLVKGGIGLVGEAGLKSRIEQMTQRTRQVEPFDSLKVLVPNAPLQVFNLFKPLRDEGGSFDFKLEAFVNVKMYFDQVYSLFDGIAGGINEVTRATLRNSDTIPALKNANDWLKDGLKQGDQTLIDVTDTPTSTPQTNITIKPFGLNQDNKLSNITAALQGGSYTETSNYHSVNAKIKADLEYFSQKDDQSFAQDRKLLAADVIRSYDLDTSVHVNTQGFDTVKAHVNVVLNSELENNAKTKNRIKQDRDGWLKHLATSQFVSNDSQVYSLKTKLLDMDPQTLSYVRDYDIEKEYIGTQKTVVDGYVQGLKNADYLSLGMQKSDYDQSVQYLDNLKEKVDLARENANTVNRDEKEQINCSLCDKKTPHPVLLSQNNSSNQNNTTQSNSAFAAGGLLDPTRYINGYFIKGDDGKYHNVIAHLVKGEQLRQTSFEKDLDGNNVNDIILWDAHNVYVKYAEVQNNQQGMSKASVTVVDLNTVDDLLTQIDSYGFFGGWGDRLKIWSPHHMSRKRYVAGQAYESMTYTIANEMNENIVGYAVRYTDSLTKEYLKNANYKYLLLLDKKLQGDIISDVDLDGVRMSLRDSNVVYVDSANLDISAVLNNLPRRRYYSQVGKLSRIEQTSKLFGIIALGGDKSTRIFKSSPWSNTETAGMQIIADTSAPYADISMVRDKKPAIVSQGDSLYGTIKTFYNLSGQWFDDAKVIKSRIYSGTKLIYSGDSDKIFVGPIYSDMPITIHYQFVGQDSAGNIGQKTVTLELKLPELKLDDVQTNTLGQSDIVSSLNTDVDQGAVKFIRIRNGVESVLQSMFGSKTLFNTTTNQLNVVGGKFGFKQDIGFYDVKGKYLNVSITPEGQIINNNPSIKVVVDFNESVPNIVLLQNNQELYRIYLKPKAFDTKDIVVLNGGYENLQLPNDPVGLGQFAGGTCIKPKNGNCEVIVAKDGYFAAVKPYHRLYKGTYGFEFGKVIYTIQKGNTSIAELKITAESVKN